jgi:hypothetical protein
MDVQMQLVRRLQEVVRSTREFNEASSRDELITLPTGDGMALVFFGSPEDPVRCALQISRTLRNQSENLRLRMGIHSGPVYRVADINANRNVAGGGINLAQRVMDCGDAGHILVSSGIAATLEQISSWGAQLHHLGETRVKHDVKVDIFNLFTSDAGNPERPAKFRHARRSRGTRRLVGAGIVVASFALLAGYVWRKDWKPHAVERGQPGAVAGVGKSVGESVDERIIFDFLGEAPAARWTSGFGANVLPWRGNRDDPRGFALSINGEELEDGSRPGAALLTHPEWKENNQGQIIGDFTLRDKIRPGDRFKSQVGFLRGAHGQVEFVVEAFGGTLGESGKLVDSLQDNGNDGALREFDVELSQVSGATNVRLTVNAGATSGQDQAVWINPRIVRPHKRS